MGAVLGVALLADATSLDILAHGERLVELPEGAVPVTVPLMPLDGARLPLDVIEAVVPVPLDFDDEDINAEELDAREDLLDRSEGQAEIFELEMMLVEDIVAEESEAVPLLPEAIELLMDDLALLCTVGLVNTLMLNAVEVDVAIELENGFVLDTEVDVAVGRLELLVVDVDVAVCVLIEVTPPSLLV